MLERFLFKTERKWRNIYKKEDRYRSIPVEHSHLKEKKRFRAVVPKFVHILKSWRFVQKAGVSGQKSEEWELFKGIFLHLL